MVRSELNFNIADRFAHWPAADVALATKIVFEILSDALVKENRIELRGFGTFVVKKRAEKTGRNISKNTTLIIPEHYVPQFKPSKSFVNGVKNKVKK